MHELGLCDAMLKMVRGIMKEEAIQEIQRITIEVGTLSGVVPAYMEDCWEAVADGTELEGAEFVVETLQGLSLVIPHTKPLLRSLFLLRSSLSLIRSN